MKKINKINYDVINRFLSVDITNEQNELSEIKANKLNVNNKDTKSKEHLEHLNLLSDYTKNKEGIEIKFIENEVKIALLKEKLKKETEDDI